MENSTFSLRSNDIHLEKMVMPFLDLLKIHCQNVNFTMSIYDSRVGVYFTLIAVIYRDLKILKSRVTPNSGKSEILLTVLLPKFASKSDFSRQIIHNFIIRENFLCSFVFFSIKGVARGKGRKSPRNRKKLLKKNGVIS